MIAVIQRVERASVEVEGRSISEIGRGLLTLLGVEKGDDESQLKKLIEKIVQLRVFADDQGKMNLSLRDIAGEHLIISQFTLAGDCSKGRRPHFLNAEHPDLANTMYEKSLKLSREMGIDTFGGEFGGDMQVSLLNDGPVTFILRI